MDLFKNGADLSYIGQLLETIRNLSNGEATNFHQTPFDNDIYLLQHLLDEKIILMLDNKNSSLAVEPNYLEALRQIDTHIRCTPEPVEYIVQTLKETLPEYEGY